MKFKDKDKSILSVNDFIYITGIPPEAHEYQVNGRTPLEWLIDRYCIKKDGHSGIVNDPNGWFDDSQDLIVAFRRLVHVSVKTVTIVENLPCPFSDLVK